MARKTLPGSISGLFMALLWNSPPGDLVIIGIGRTTAKTPPCIRISTKTMSHGSYETTFPSSRGQVLLGQVLLGVTSSILKQLSTRSFMMRRASSARTTATTQSSASQGFDEFRCVMIKTMPDCFATGYADKAENTDALMIASRFENEFKLNLGDDFGVTPLYITHHRPFRHRIIFG